MSALVLGLGLMVAVFVGTVERAAYAREASCPAIANMEFETQLSAPPVISENIVIFNPTPNVDMLFPSFGGNDIPPINTANSKPKGLAR